jgi:hypothetical protein
MNRSSADETSYTSGSESLREPRLRRPRTAGPSGGGRRAGGPDAGLERDRRRRRIAPRAGPAM